MNDKPLYNRNTLKAMFFKPNEYINALPQDEYFQARLTEFRKNLRDKAFRDSLLAGENCHVFQTIEASTLTANIKPIETIVNSRVAKKMAKSVNPLTIQAGHSSPKKKKRKKNKLIIYSELAQILPKAKSIRTKSARALYKAAIEIQDSREKLKTAVKRYQKILIELEKDKPQLPLNEIQIYTELHNYITLQIELIKNAPAYYYIQRARFNETRLTNDNISCDTIGWNDVISDYVTGEMQLKFDTQEDILAKKSSLYKLITLYQKSKDLPKAINYCNKILNTYPEDAKAYYLRAVSYDLNKQWLLALTDIRQALSYKANFPKDENIDYEDDAQKLCLKLAAMLMEPEQNIQQPAYPGL